MSASTLRVLCSTWNVGNKPATELSPWLPKNGEGFDVISVALQECLWKDKAKSPSSSARSESSAVLLEEDSDDEAEANDAGGPMPTVEIAGEAASPPQAESSPAVPAAATAATAPAPEGAAAPVPPASPSKPADGSNSAPQGSPISGVAAGVGAGAAVSPHKPALASGILKTAMKGNEDAPIIQLVTAHLGSEWEKVRGIMLWQTGLLVFVRKSLASRIGKVECDMEATGILGVGQNKGGLAIGLEIDGTRLLFLGAHLAAHMRHNADRNANVQEILNNIRLGGEKGFRSLVETDLQYQHVFFSGDLNYRVDLAIPGGGQQGIDEPDHRAAVRALVDENKLSELLAADQLKMSQRDNKAWFGFNEADITFQPTFSMLREGGNVYAHKRVPSYCDRVLWKSLPAYAKDVKCASYKSFPEISSSDHKPVSASFEVTLRGAADVSGICPQAMSLPVDQLPRLVFPGGLEGKGLLALDYSGRSDPYLLFHSDPHGLIHSKHITKLFSVESLFGKKGAASASAPTSPSATTSPNATAAAGEEATAATTSAVVQTAQTAQTPASPEGVSVTVAPVVEATSPDAAATAEGPVSPSSAVSPGAASATTARGEGSAASFQVPKSKVKSQTLNPKWTESDLPELPLRISDPSQLEKAHVIIVCMDHDIADAHDRMGNIVLPLSAFASMPKQGAGSTFSVPFSLPVVKNSVAHGTISGRMQIIWPGVINDAAASSTAASSTTAALPSFPTSSSPSEVNQACCLVRNCTVQ